MLFSSIPFLYYFLTAVIIVYAIMPKRLKNYVLLFSSLFFYGWGGPDYLILMITSIVLGYIYGLLIEKTKGTKASKGFVILSIVTSIGFLGYFKYADFFIENFNAVFGSEVPLLHVVLPIGISFYTFQILSYTIDVYRGQVPAQKNLGYLATYISMFPQLIAGPIVRYSDVAPQLADRKHTFEDIAIGIRRFVIGLSKKILIANSFGEFCSIFQASDDKSVLFFWLYAVAFSLQIYFDFSGYSDMAIGFGRMFGFRFLENFNYPYISKSITEFWRRWHMSLGSWFRDYVYIPLGGNRVSKPRWYFNILVVWMLTGFWHGATWNFVVWGLYFAVFLIIEKLFLLNKLEKLKALNHIYVLFFVIISFVIFNAADLPEAMQYIGAMFGAGDYPLISAECIYYAESYALTFAIAVFAATPIAKNVINKAKENETRENLINVLEVIALVLLVLFTTAYLVDGSFNPFLYFRF